MIRKRILALALTVCLLALCMAGLSGCSSTKTLFTVDGNAVTDGFFSFYMYEYLTAMYNDLGDNMVSSEDMISSSVTVGNYVKDLVYNSIVDDYATIAMGEENGITLNSTDYSSGKVYKANFIAELEANGTPYKQFLKNIGTNDSDIDLFCRNVALISRVRTTLLADSSPYYPSEAEIQEITKDFHENYICLTYVVQSTTDVTGALLKDAELAVSREKCEAAREAFKTAEDYKTVVEEYSEDLSGRESPYTIYLTLDSITDEALLAAVKPMQIGDVSDVIETSNGYMVVKRLALNEEQLPQLVQNYMQEKIDARKSTLQDGFSILKTTDYDAFAMKF